MIDGGIFLIAISDMAVSRRIKTMLTNLFFDKAIVFECGEFIRGNLHNCKSEHYFLICNSYIERFRPHNAPEKIFRKYHIRGGGSRENAYCPLCGSMDRERWVMYVLRRYTKIFWEESTVLHFAPEGGLAQKIRNNDKCDYYTCDLSAGRAAHIVDVTDIPFKENTFDYIIMNHVLEHVKEEEKAVLELMRVLKPTGKIILSFPICMEMKTLENDEIRTEEQRTEAYGQGDHVRLYGYDFKERLQRYGLKINVYSPMDISEETEKYGFIPDDIVMLCEI